MEVRSSTKDILTLCERVCMSIQERMFYYQRDGAEASATTATLQAEIDTKPLSEGVNAEVIITDDVVSDALRALLQEFKDYPELRYLLIETRRLYQHRHAQNVRLEVSGGTADEPIFTLNLVTESEPPLTLLRVSVTGDPVLSQMQTLQFHENTEGRLLRPARYDVQTQAQVLDALMNYLFVFNVTKSLVERTADDVAALAAATE